MMPLSWDTIALCLTIAGTSCGGGFTFAIWLRGQLDAVKVVLGETIRQHEISDAKQFEKIRERLIVIETKTEINHHDIKQSASYGG